MPLQYKSETAVQAGFIEHACSASSRVTSEVSYGSMKVVHWAFGWYVKVIASQTRLTVP